MKYNFFDIERNLAKGFLLLCLILLLNPLGLTAQNKERRVTLFDLDQVSLGNSAFKNAQKVDLEYIFSLEPDRLLAPFLKEAGLNPKAESYPNWENTGLDGHIGGHYLTALSLMYASTGNEKLLDRLDYMLEELEKVQQENGDGYIGGVPGSKALWKEIASGHIDAGSFSLNDKWVPLYNIHKTYAGLRDAYQIAGLEKAKPMLVAFTDWMLNITTDFSEEQFQKLLISEHGGLNETFADVAQITGDRKYLDLAYNFSHETLLNPLEEERDVLNGMHANTQIPKVVGFETIASLDGNEDYHNAAKYFWNNVVNKRTVAIGGNSVREHFHPADDFSTMISSIQGPETCNTYNMLKLSKKLFQAEADEKYIDYYEQGLYNHILSSQHPVKGGFVYFTPMRPGHYRVYSQPETSFWCCVGSGLENHGKYNELIYAHTEDDLYVNLFIPSKVNWEEKEFFLTQDTRFPEEESTTFLISTKIPQQLNLKLRYPRWFAEGEMDLKINGKPLEVSAGPGEYISLNRLWKEGDKIEMKLPMKLHSLKLPDGTDYKALKYGPMVLGAKTGDEDIQGLFADDSRGGHIAEGKKIPLSETPLFLVKNKNDDLSKYISKEIGELKFIANEVIHPVPSDRLEFIPFYKIHDSRYVIYLPVETPESLKQIQKKRKEQELREEKLARLTLDKVSPGEQQPESDHFIKSENSSIGVNQDRHWRDASGWFSYTFKDGTHEAGKVQVTYYGRDKDRHFKIFIEDVLLATENLKGEKGDVFFTKDYIIPEKIVEQNKENLNLRFEAIAGSRTAGVYEIRLMKIK